MTLTADTAIATEAAYLVQVFSGKTRFQVKRQKFASLEASREYAGSQARSCGMQYGVHVYSNLATNTIYAVHPSRYPRAVDVSLYRVGF